MGKYLVGVLALAALSGAAPEADPLYAPYYYRPYLASGYAGPLPGRSFQAVSRLHKRDADPQLLLNSLPYAASPLLPSPVVSAPVLAPAHAVVDAPVVKSVVEAPAVVSQTVHATPVSYAAAPLAVSAPLSYAATPFTYAAAAPLSSAVVGLTPYDCVSEGGCALKAALATGLPAATVGATTVAGRKRRDAEADADADADADAALLYNNFYGYNAFPYAYGALPYNYPAFNPYYAAHTTVVAAEAPVVAAEAPVVATAAPVYHAAAPYVAAPYVAAAAPYVAHAAPVVAAPAPVVAARVPVVENVAKEVTYTHLGAHPIAPTTVVQTESRLVL